MPDPTGNAADRFDEWLDADGRLRPDDDLTGFADRVLRDGALPEPASTVPSRDQRNRMRARVFGGVPATSKARTPMTTHTFAANGATPAPLPITERDRPATSAFSILMTAALIAVIGIAAFGLVRNSFDFSLPGGDPEPTGAPGIAMSPEATPATDGSCDLSNGISVFNGSAPDIDGLGAYALLNDSGMLALYCGNAIWELATGIEQVVYQFTPRVIAAVTDDGRVQLLDLQDGATLDLESEQLKTVSGEVTFEDAVVPGIMSPWLITPVNDERTDWRFTDLRSLESFLLSDELGGPLAVPHQPYVGAITSTDVIAISWQEIPVAPDPTPTSESDRLSDQAALVLPGSIADRRWVDLYVWRQDRYDPWPVSQPYSVSKDGELLAYTALSDTFSPVIRVEHAVDGTHVVDVPIDEINDDTHFILAGRKPHLVYTNGEKIHIAAFVEGAAREIDQFVSPHVIAMFPTANPDIVLISDSGTATMPVDVTTGESQGFYQYMPPVYFQVFGAQELPANIVTVSYESKDSSASIVSLANPSNGEVVLQSDPIDQHPVEVISYPTWLRDGGKIAIVQVGPDRALIMNATTQDVWEIEAPDDAPLWNFFASQDGGFITASPQQSTNWTNTHTTSYIAPLEPGAEWVPINSDPAAQGWHQGLPATPAA